MTSPMLSELAAERFIQRTPGYFIDDPVRCALRRQALEEALDGLAPNERCGSISGYEWHRSHGEKPCPQCREARRIYDRRIYDHKRSKEAK